MMVSWTMFLILRKGNKESYIHNHITFFFTCQICSNRIRADIIGLRAYHDQPWLPVLDGAVIT